MYVNFIFFAFILSGIDVDIFLSFVIFVFIVSCLHKHLGTGQFLGIFISFRNTLVINISGNDVQVVSGNFNYLIAPGIYYT